MFDRYFIEIVVGLPQRNSKSKRAANTDLPSQVNRNNGKILACDAVDPSDQLGMSALTSHKSLIDHRPKQHLLKYHPVICIKHR